MPPGKSAFDYVADGGAGAVAAGDVVGGAGLFGAVGEAEAGFDVVASLSLQSISSVGRSTVTPALAR